MTGVPPARLLGWSLSPHTDWSVEPAAGRDGRPALLLRQTGDDQVSKLGLSQHIDAHRCLGKRLRLTVCVRPDAPRSIWLLRASRTGAVGERAEVFVNKRFLDTEWTEHTLVIDVTPGTRQLSYGLRATCRELWVCDVRVEAEESDTAAVDSWDPRRPEPLQDSPRDLDFASLAAWTRPRKGDPVRGARDCPGSYALRSTSADGAWWGGIEQRVDAAPLRGRRVRLAGQVRTAGVVQRAGLFLCADGVDLPGLAFDGPPHSGLSGTNEWTDSAVVLDVPSSAQRLRFGFHLYGAGVARVRGLSFEQVGAETPVTDVLALLPGTPRDLDFPGPAATALQPPWMRGSTAHYDAEIDGTGGATLRCQTAWPATVMQEITADAYRGKRVRLAGQLRAIGTRPLARLRLAIEGLDRVYTWSHDLARVLEIPVDPGVWFDTAVVTDVPEDALRLRLELELFGRELHVRGLRFETVDASVHVTDESDLPSHPSNLALVAAKGSGAPPGWRAVPTESVTSDGTGVTTVRSGSGSYRGLAGCFQRFRAEPYRLKRVRLRGQTRVPVGAGEGSVGVLGLVISGQDPTRPLASGPKARQLLSASDDWTEQAIVLDVPREACVIALTAAAAGAGEISIRDLSFDVVDESVALTDGLGTHLLGPWNLSFDE